MFWHAGNFDFLRELNSAAGRTLCDLTQYPVYPWCIAGWLDAFFVGVGDEIVSCIFCKFAHLSMQTTRHQLLT